MLDPSVMLPQVAQGALAVECRADDDDDARAARARSTTRVAHARGRRRARVPRRARRRVRPAVRRAARRVDGDDGRARGVARVARRPRRAARASRGADPVDVGRAVAADARWRAAARSRPRRSSRRGRRSRDRVPRRRGPGRSRPAHRARRGAAARAPTSSCTTGSRRPRCSTSRRAGAELIDVGQGARATSTMTQDEINALLVDAGPRRPSASCGSRAATRSCSGAAARRPRRCVAAGVPFEVVPGITSAIARRRVRGHPGDAPRRLDHFTVVTGHEDPAKGTHRHRLGRARAGGGTLVILMGAGRIGEIAQRADRGRPRARHAGRRGALGHPARPAHGARHARRRSPTRASRRRARSSSATVAALDLAWFEHRPLFGRTVVVTRAREQASELRARLEELGAEVIELPGDRDRAARRSTLPDARPRTSGSCSRRRTASTRSSTAASRRAGLDARALAGVRVAAIGPGTAAALARARAARRPRARAVRRRVAARGVPAAAAPGARVLLARAEVARDVLPEGLAAAGYAVDVLAGVPHRAGRRPTRRSSRACAPARSTRSRSRRRRRSTTSATSVGAAPRPATARRVDRSGHVRDRARSAACASTPRPIRTRSTASSPPARRSSPCASRADR